MTIPDFFKTKSSISDIHGFGKIEVGDSVTVDMDVAGMTPAKLRSHISSHGQYHGKRFKTRMLEGVMHIFRES